MKPSSGSKQGHRKLNADERRTIYEALLELFVDGQLPHGALSETARVFQLHWTTISRVWVRARRSILGGGALADISNKMAGNCGRKRTRLPETSEEAVKSTQMQDRQTLRSLAEHSGIPKTTLIRHMKEGKRLQGQSSYLKPSLTEVHAERRLHHAMSFLQPSTRQNHTNMHSYVHIDEKWFFLTKVKRRHYAYDDEVVPCRSGKSRHFVTKVMFLAAVARPRYDYSKKKIFDGKLGVWPLVETTVAKRGTKNRAKGTPFVAPTRQL
ncbi:hypothetical protein AeMF1_018014 [Aphanomyces euteiches]|nr:hypothetical protein AeMF1_018014 [Aphanomyces euteiches]KAH9185565.1 hypothetical protein AeNC1_012460 [Aphanomyces euteiches]